MAFFASFSVIGVLIKAGSRFQILEAFLEKLSLAGLYFGYLVISSTVLLFRRLDLDTF